MQPGLPWWLTTSDGSLHQLQARQRDAGANKQGGELDADEPIDSPQSIRIRAVRKGAVDAGPDLAPLSQGASALAELPAEPLELVPDDQEQFHEAQEGTEAEEAAAGVGAEVPDDDDRAQLEDAVDGGSQASTLQGSSRQSSRHVDFTLPSPVALADSLAASPTRAPSPWGSGSASPEGGSPARVHKLHRRVQQLEAQLESSQQDRRKANREALRGQQVVQGLNAQLAAVIERGLSLEARLQVSGGGVCGPGCGLALQYSTVQAQQHLAGPWLSWGQLRHPPPTPTLPPHHLQAARGERVAAEKEAREAAAQLARLQQHAGQHEARVQARLDQVVQQLEVVLVERAALAAQVENLQKRSVALEGGGGLGCVWRGWSVWGGGMGGGKGAWVGRERVEWRCGRETGGGPWLPSWSHCRRGVPP